MERFVLYLPTPEATQSLGRRLGELFFPGSIIALIGPLGAGKTFLVRSIGEGLGVPDSRVISSPTFVLIQEYAGGRLPIYHFDTYRLKNVADFVELGVHEYFEGNGVCLIEWADRVTAVMPAEYLTIMLTVTGESSRSMTLEAHGQRYEEMLDALR